MASAAQQAQPGQLALQAQLQLLQAPRVPQEAQGLLVPPGRHLPLQDLRGQQALLELQVLHLQLRDRPGLQGQLARHQQLLVPQGQLVAQGRLAQLARPALQVPLPIIHQ